MSENKSKTAHKKYQSDISAFRKTVSNKAIDVIVLKSIQDGKSEISYFEKLFKRPFDTIKEQLTPNLFKIDGNKLQVS